MWCVLLIYTRRAECTAGARRVRMVHLYVSKSELSLHFRVGNWRPIDITQLNNALVAQTLCPCEISVPYNYRLVIFLAQQCAISATTTNECVCLYVFLWPMSTFICALTPPRWDVRRGRKVGAEYKKWGNEFLYKFIHGTALLIFIFKVKTLTF